LTPRRFLRFISLPHPPSSHSRSHPPFPPSPNLSTSKFSSRAPPAASSSAQTLSNILPPTSYSDPDVASGTVQTFLSLAYDELHALYEKEVPAVAAGGDEEKAGEEEKKREKDLAKREREVEKKVTEGLDRVEGVVMGLGYNLFVPSRSFSTPIEVWTDFVCSVGQLLLPFRL
jgi:hypothetical protein